MSTVATLRIAPVKALATVTVAKVTIGPQGVPEDRRLFLVDAADAVVTQRSHPQLSQVVPDLDLAAGVLSVQLPDGAVVGDELTSPGPQLRTSLFGRERVGRVIDGGVAEALSALAGERVRLVLADSAGTGWDEGPVSILGRASAAHIGAPSGDTLRFRMLVELDGTAPYEEEAWVGREIELGAARLFVRQPLDRCVVITQSPLSGEHDWDGLRVLAEERGRDHLCLGVIADVVTPGDVAVGDDLTVL